MESVCCEVVPIGGMTTPKAHSITDFLSWLETKATKDAIGASPAQVSGAVRLFLGAVPDASNPPSLTPFIEGLKGSASQVTSAKGEPLTPTTASGYITRIRRAYKAFAAPRSTKAAPKAKAAPKSAKATPVAKAATKAPASKRVAKTKAKGTARKAGAKRAAPQVTHVEAAPESAFGVSARASVAPRSSRAMSSSRTMVPQPAGDLGPFGRVNIGELEATSKAVSKLLRQARAAS